MNSYERTSLAFISTNLLHKDSERHLPIPVFSFIKPTMGHRFILHILLSMGHYETELDLLLHRNLKNALRYAKLIGPSDNKSDLEYYSNQLQKKFIEEQLVYFPNSSKMISNWIIIAGELFDSVIINDEIPITEMPPVLQTQLECVQEEKIYMELDKIKKTIIDSSYQELQHVGHYFGLPIKDTLSNASIECPLKWDLLSNFQQTPFQSEESFIEQKKAIEIGISTIDSYC